LFIDALQIVDLDYLQAEQNKELSAGTIRRRRMEICEEAMKTLASFKAFHIAEKAVIENIVSLERLNDRDHEQVQMHEKLGRALRDLREGVEATRRMLQERCKVREGASV
jgi:hypothetical protein